MKKVFELGAEMKAPLRAASLVSAILGILFLGYGASSIYRGENAIVSGLLVVIGGAQWFIAWGNLNLINTLKIVTSPEQLAFYSPGVMLSTPWDNLERIGRTNKRFTNVPYESLVLRHPPTQKISPFFKVFQKVPEKQIPLNMFSDWRTSELGEEIQKYAPHLFSEHASAPSP